MRVVYEVTNSQQDARFVYDEFTLNFNTACYNYALPAVVGNEVADKTYSIYPSSVADSLTVSWTDDGSSSCDDSRTVQWYYKQQTLAEWEEFSCPSSACGSPEFITLTSATTLNLGSSTWSWGDVYEGTTDY